MPRGDNPNSRANLIKPTKDLTAKERRERASRAGKASGEARQRLKTFKELDDEYTTDAERKKMLDMLKKRAEQGNLKAWELYATFMGMKPTEKVAVQTVDSNTIDELKKALSDRDDDLK